MERASASSSRAAVAIVTTALLALCCTAARPLGPQEAVTSPLGLPPAAGQLLSVAALGYDDAAPRAGKWLPFAGPDVVGFPHHHLPAAFWAHKPMPWVGLGAGAHGGSGAIEGGGEDEEQLVRERDRSYERGESDTTREEQLASWASLLKPKEERREANGWLPAPAIGEAADEEPAKMSDGAAEGAEVEDPGAGGVQVGQTKPGFSGGATGTGELFT